MLEFDAKTATQLERAYQGRDFVRRRHANIRALNPRPGQALCDIGCGTGQMLRELAFAVGAEGRITGIEPSADMRARAEAATQALECVTVFDGSAEALRVGDASQDGIVSLQVFEYLPDLAPAVAECRRALRTGGRLVIGDLHFGTLAWAADDPGRMERMIRAWDAHFADRAVPEKLLRHLGPNGFRHRASIPMTFVDTGPAPDGLARMMQTLMQEFAHRSGQLSEDEARAWSNDLDNLAAEDRYFFSITHVITVAEAV